jgi:mono/diheme cytochrome c family protein
VLLALSSNQKIGILIVAGAFVAFALVSAVVIPRSHPDFPGKRLGVYLGVAAAFTVAMLLTIAFVARETGEEEQTAATETSVTRTETAPPPVETTTESTVTESSTTTEATPPAGAGDAAAGKVVFKANCSGCHTLSDAGASGTVGPNLDAASPSYDLVVERATNGKGVMPSFQGNLTETQIQDVAAYVSSVATGS